MPSRLQVPVDIPPESGRSDDPDNLSMKINQIFIQKGPFRTVTEQSVALGPETDEDSEPGDDGVGPDESDNETREERQELLIKAREELFATIHRGTLQCNQALDFTSLFLSKHSRAAQGTFSDALRHSLKPGMFDGLFLENARYAPTIRPKQELSKGWRTKSFISASEKLESASKRLKREADSQSSFWQQVAEVGHDGWKVCRHPRDRRAMGVHFAMPESAPQFRAQGFARLRHDSESTLHLDRQASSKCISVTVSRAGHITGRHHAGTVASERGSAATRELLDARDNLIEEELFYELGREARLAANQGIVTRGEDIEFTINGQYSVILSLRPSLGQVSPVGRDDSLAKYISLSLRSLLVQAHHENYFRRTRPPAPITMKTAHIQEHAILRPLIAALRHSTVTKELRERLASEVLSPLRLAGLQVSFEEGDAQQSLRQTEANSPSIVSTETQQAVYTLTIPNKSLDIKVTTYLGRPIYGTAYDIATDSAIRYDSLKALLNAIFRLLLRHLVTFVASETSTDEASWEIVQAYKGELLLKTGTAENEPVTLRLSLGLGALTAKVGGRQQQQSWVWKKHAANETGSEAAADKTLLDVVRSTMREA